MLKGKCFIIFKIKLFRSINIKSQYSNRWFYHLIKWFSEIIIKIRYRNKDSILSSLFDDICIRKVTLFLGLYKYFLTNWMYVVNWKFLLLFYWTDIKQKFCFHIFYCLCFVDNPSFKVLSQYLNILRLWFYQHFFTKFNT